MDKDLALTILDDLKSGERDRTKEARKLFYKLLHAHFDEIHGKKHGNEATGTMAFVRDECMILCDSTDAKLRFAGLKGLNGIAFSGVFDEKIPELQDIFMNALKDDNGHIRMIAANAIGYIRLPVIGGKKGRFTESMFVDLYLTLQGMFDLEKDRMKRRSIEQALANLCCPYLERLMLERGYSPAIGA